jgi:putative endonuclease
VIVRKRFAALAERFGQWLRRGRADLGHRGERAAARYLRRAGYRVVARGLRTTHGELDLVAVETAVSGRSVVFVEVKTRTTHDAGHPVEAVTPDKQRRLTRAAVAFLKRHGLLEYRSRFDVVAVTWPDGQTRPVIEHFKNAFEAVGRGQFYR